MKWISLSKPDFTSNRIYVSDNTDGLLSGLITLLNAYVIGAMKHLHYDIHDTLEMFNDDKCQDLILSWNVCKRLWYDHIENAPKDISSGLHVETLKYICHMLTLQFRSTPKKYCKFLRIRIKLLQDHDYHDEDNERVIISKEMIERRKMIQKRKRTDSETDNESS